MSEEIKETKEASAPADTANTSEDTKSAGDNTSAQSESRSNNSGYRGDRGDRGDSRGRQQDGDKRQKFSRFKKKVCKFCHNKELPIDYKRPDILVRFLTDRGKILPRRITGTCAKHQRRVAAEVKRARMIALLPFVEQ